ncbi:unnamed protein product [Urochloa humidicola]
MLLWAEIWAIGLLLRGLKEGVVGGSPPPLLSSPSLTAVEPGGASPLGHLSLAARRSRSDLLELRGGADSRRHGGGRLVRRPRPHLARARCLRFRVLYLVPWVRIDDDYHGQRGVFGCGKALSPLTGNLLKNWASSCSP